MSQVTIDIVASGGIVNLETTEVVYEVTIVVGTNGMLGAIEGTEMIAPDAPPANGYRIYAEDNGAGKTRLMVLFASGAAQQIAIQP